MMYFKYPFYESKREIEKRKYPKLFASFYQEKDRESFLIDPYSKKELPMIDTDYEEKFRALGEKIEYVSPDFDDHDAARDRFVEAFKDMLLAWEEYEASRNKIFRM